MSQEWLKKLAEISDDKALMKRPRQLEKAERRRQPTSRPANGRSSGLFGAAFGFFFRWLFLLAVAQAAAMFIVAQSQGISNEPWGYIFHYLVWYALTQPIFPEVLYAALQDWFGLTPAALSDFYDQINPRLQEQQDVLLFYVPAAAALALTLFFLPAINARRRLSQIRFLVWLANWAVVFLAVAWRPGVIVLWLAAFVFSFVGRGAPRAAPRQPQSQPQTMPPEKRPPPRAQKAARVRDVAPASAIDRTPRPAMSLNKREPTVVRRSGGASWIRAR